MASTNPLNKAPPARVADYFTTIGASPSALISILTAYTFSASSVGLGAGAVGGSGSNVGVAGGAPLAITESGSAVSADGNARTASASASVSVAPNASSAPGAAGRNTASPSVASASSSTATNPGGSALDHSNSASASAIAAAGAGGSATAAFSRAVSSLRRQSLASTPLKPAVLSRFPPVDHADTEHPRDLPLFVFPAGYAVSERPQRPECASFVLTEADGTRVYGVYLRFHHELRDLVDQLAAIHTLTAPPGTPLPFDPAVCKATMGQAWVPFVVCVTSHWAFLTQLSSMLRQLFHKVILASQALKQNHVRAAGRLSCL